MQKYKNLQRLLVSLFLLLSVAPLFLVTYLSYEIARKSLYGTVTENMTQIAKDKALAINHWIFERISDAEVMSKTLSIEALESTTQVHPELNRYLKTIKDIYRYYDEIFILDIRGNSLAWTGEKEGNKAQEDYFIKAIKGMPTITDVRISEITGKPTMLIACSIRKEQEEVIGVLVERIKLDLTSKIMKEIKVGKTGESYLLNKEGYFLTESKFEKDCILKKQAITEGFINCKKYHQGVGEYIDYRGKPVLGSYLWIPDREWCLMVEQDVEEAFSQISSLRNITIAICLITAFLVICISFWVSGRIIGTLKKKDAELDIQMQELLKAEKLAAAGKLAAGIAHEIGNPLTGIVNCAKLISKELDSSGSCKEKKEIIKYLTSIEREAMRCSDTLRKFLNLTKESKLKFEKTNVNQLIEDVISLITPQTVSQKINIEKQLNSVPNISGDGIQLEQAFTNIVLNSLSAMSSGGELYIETSEKDESVEIVFSDTGTGIAKEHLSRIFEPFFTTKREGTGLGLSVVYNIIDKHNGSIIVESEVGKGTKFVIRLPVRKLKD